VLFGSSGLIGSGLARALQNRDVLAFAWSESPGFIDQVLSALDPFRAYDFVFAGGLTDSKLSFERIRYSNTLFPQQLMEATASFSGARYLTIGTVMENFPDACEPNAYLRSKLELGRWLVARSSEPQWAGRCRHVRLHTVYGGTQLKPHMFLGQVVAALRANQEFRMSSGEQLREYHHVDDVVLSLTAILEAQWDRHASPILEISSGHAVKLGELARAIFHAFGKDELLRIGAIPRAQSENLDQIFPPAQPWLLPHTREPITGVIEWVRGILA
jgi:nucleoside-diphosphate-sugar epimerase